MEEQLVDKLHSEVKVANFPKVLRDLISSTFTNHFYYLQRQSLRRGRYGLLSIDGYICLTIRAKLAIPQHIVSIEGDTTKRTVSAFGFMLRYMRCILLQRHKRITILAWNKIKRDRALLIRR
jgi:hypothetical protein